MTDDIEQQETDDAFDWMERQLAWLFCLFAIVIILAQLFGG